MPGTPRGHRPPTLYSLWNKYSARPKIWAPGGRDRVFHVSLLSLFPQSTHMHFCQGWTDCCGILFSACVSECFAYLFFCGTGDGA